MMQLNEDEVVKLADVGLTKPERDISGTICGSTCYSAPEVKSSPELHHIILLLESHCQIAFLTVFA